MDIKLFLTPLPFERANVSDKTVVVIDVLRSSTSICASLKAGARGVIPTAGPGEAVEMRSKLGADNALLAGERDGVKIENFHLGNSPLEFTDEVVKNKYIILTTTNGTAIFNQANKARLIVSCGLVNVSRAAQKVAGENRDVMIVCAGEKGGFSIEDTLCGGMLIHLLSTMHKKEVVLSDAGSLALLLYRANKTAIRQSIAQGEHGRSLASLGFKDDVEFATEVDALPVLPVLKDGRLILESDAVSV
ncbi:MAG: 2-phosphosulfolactate phosphatase [candidate division Zixibacteria bacterium]|nr:2-phosphosulfolactate phosphatase [candidate division Zixibacteria bacterium]